MKQTIYTVCKYMGLFAISRQLTRKRIRILGYHGIWLGDGHYGNFLFMSSKKFAQRMRKLKELGMSVISMDEAIAGQKNGTLPNYATVITIDDGWYSSYKYMLPELEKNQFPAVLYVTTYYSGKQVPVFNVALQYLFATTKVQTIDAQKINIGHSSEVDLTSIKEKSSFTDSLQAHACLLPSEEDRQQLLSLLAEELELSYSSIVESKLFHLADEEQLKEMVQRGVDIQLHTHRHRISVDGVDCLEQELMDNKSKLDKVSDKPLLHFCYPSGIFDQSFWPILEKLGMVSATTTESGLVNKKSPPYALPRILDGEDVSDIEFEAEMSGFGEIKRSFIRWIGHIMKREQA